MESGTPVGRSTVYRYLNALGEEGILRRYTIKRKISSCYQHVGEDMDCNENYHLLCDNCGMVIHFNSDELEAAFKSLKQNGLSLDHQRTVFYGKCQFCINNKG